MNQQVITGYRYIPAVEALSGNVRKKLEHLQVAATLENSFEFELKQMEAAIPDDVLLEDIDIRLGASWIEPSLVRQFIYDTLHVQAAVDFTPVGAAWGITPGYYVRSMENDDTYGLEWKTWQKNKDGKWVHREKTLTGLDLLEMALNLKKPRIRIRLEPGGPTKPSLLLTTQASAKQEQLQNAFSDWCRSDEERAEYLQRTYNDRFNSIKLREWDGSFLSLRGMTEAWKEKLSTPGREYQKDTVAMNIAQGGGNWLEVGLGKTAVMIASAWERKRVGNCRKPVILVKKATLSQIAKTVVEMYPEAKVLVANEGDLSKHQRQLFMSKIASNDWDTIVLTHEQFKSIPMKVEYQTRYYQDEIDKVSADLNNLLATQRRGAKDKPGSVKILERRGKYLANKVKKLASKKDNGLCWEDLGIDLLIVDEYDCFKNLGYHTQLTGVIGMGDPEGSDRALDFDMKRLWLIERYGRNRLIGDSGTPIANSMVEMWKTLRDFIPDTLQEMGILAFDSWAALFGHIIEQPEITQAGAIKTRQRFAKFINLPELLLLFNLFSKVVRADDVGVERPEPKRYTVAARMSPYQEFYANDLVERAMQIEEAMSDDKKNPRMWCPIKWYDFRAFEELRQSNEEYMFVDPIDPESDSYRAARNNPHDVYQCRQNFLELMHDKKLPEIDPADWRKTHSELDTALYLRSGPHAHPDPEDEDLWVYKIAYDNMLRLSTDGRMSSLDGRLRHWEIMDDPSIPEVWDKWDYSKSKVNLCARRVAGI